jgi:integrase
MPLTDLDCLRAMPTARVRKLSDGGGLQLWILPTGSRSWRLAYRQHGKQKLLTIGRYPTVSVEQARRARDDAKKALAGKPGVQAQVRPSIVRAKDDSFRSIAAEYLSKQRREGRADATLEKKQWLLGFATCAFGRKPLRDIKPYDVLQVLQEVEARGCYETARRLRSTIGAVFRYGVATLRAETDPTVVLRGALTTPIVKSHAAITDPIKFGALLRAIDDFDGLLTTRAGLKLHALLFPRPGELRKAEWSEFDLERSVWTIPAARTKMRREHKTFLAPAAIAVLNDLHAITGRGRLVFPGLVSFDKPICENTLNGALRRLGYGPDEMTSHGFRASASTLLDESGKWSVEAIERQLAHVDRSSSRRAYARGERWHERVTMMAWWAGHIDDLRREDGRGLKTFEHEDCWLASSYATFQDPS